MASSKATKKSKEAATRKDARNPSHGPMAERFLDIRNKKLRT